MGDKSKSDFSEVNQISIYRQSRFVIMARPRKSLDELPDQARRLAEARARRGYPDAASAARAIGIPIPTYTHYENGTIGFSRHVVKLARAFGVSPQWLLTGVEDGAAPTISIAGRVGAGGQVQQPEEFDTAIDHVDALTADAVIGYEVDGDSMYPRYMHGEVILAQKEPRLPDDLIKRYAVVDVADGRRLIKIVERGTKTGHFTLISHNAPPEFDVRIIAARAVIGVLTGPPPREILKIPKGRR